MLVDQQNDRPQPIRHYYDTTRQVHAESKTRRIWGLMSGCEGLKGTGEAEDMSRQESGFQVCGWMTRHASPVYCDNTVMVRWTIVVAYVGSF
jgi:hypothetical protein